MKKSLAALQPFDKSSIETLFALRSIFHVRVVHEWRHLILDDVGPPNLPTLSRFVVIRHIFCRHKILHLSSWRNLWITPWAKINSFRTVSKWQYFPWKSLKYSHLTDQYFHKKLSVNKTEEMKMSVNFNIVKYCSD